MNRSESKNISDYLYRVAERNPDKAAFLHPFRLSFKEFTREIDRFAEGFRNKGIHAGMRTIVLITPGMELFAASIALFRIGAIPVMIDPGMGIRRMVKALKGVKAEAFVSIPRALFLPFLFPGSFSSLRSRFSTGCCWPFRAISLKKLPYVPYGPVAHPLDKDGTAALFYTSGSTGPPKGVIYTKGMLEAQIQILKTSFGYTADEIDLCTFPLVGLLLLCLGVSLVLADMDMAHPAKLKPRAILKNISDHNCTHMFCSPMVLMRLAEYGKGGDIRLNSLKWVMTAGAPVMPGVIRDFRKLLCPDAEIHTPYGSTEALPLTSINDKELSALYTLDETLKDGLCVGYPLKGIALKILAISDHPVPLFAGARFLEENQVGEIVVCGPNVSETYWMDAKANELAKIYESESGSIWHRTGDLGRIDQEGRLWFYGRKNQRVLRSDKVYFTIPVEAVFNRHPEVARSALVGVAKVDDQDKIPVICIERVKNKKRKIYLHEQLQAMASGNGLTRDIEVFLFHRKFPVDPRHNAKIFREKLAEWARIKMKL